MVRSVLVSVLVLGASLGCVPEQEHRAGEPRVISLAPGLTETLLALGAGHLLVGVDRYSQQIPGLVGVPSLGALFSPDLERTVELEPTLVLGIQSAQQHDFFGRLRERGIRVEILSPVTLEEVLASYELLGQLVGRPDAGRALRVRVAEGLSALEEETSGREPRTVAMLVEREPLYVVGGGSFVSALIAAAGGRNVFGDLELPYPSVSLEALAERAPEVLIDSTSGAAAARTYWERFSWVRRVEVISEGVVTLPGPRLVESARILAGCIHPQLGGSRQP